MKTETVFVGLSGGVDSSVAALRLLEAGYRVVGVFIRVWHPDFILCNEEDERLDAMRVASHLGIPFLTCDAVGEYKSDVADYMIAEYKKGRTPNPDVMCNRAVKFGAFLKFALKHGADKIATGHYAQVKKSEDGTHVLLTAIDTSKDQSYFLWTLTEEQLSKVLFPIGDTLKSDVRKEAEQAKLPTAEKKDSQGICFLGAIDMKEFLSHYITEQKGAVVTEKGEVIGEHDGALFYTIGQRHGFRIHNSGKSTASQYVVSKDIEKNILVVSSEKSSVYATIFTLSDVVLRGEMSTILTAPITVATRYHKKPVPATFSLIDSDFLMTLPKESEMPSAGQSAVLYMDSVCLGGGIIEPINQ